MAYYAWSPIRYTYREEDGKEITKSVKRGATVKRSDFKGMSEKEWEAKIAAGAIMNRKYPAPDDFTGSGIEYIRAQLQDARAMTPVDEEEAVSELEELESLAR